MAATPEKPRIVFLTYMSRSGSTFLAQQLSRLAGVCVGIEARLADGWIRGTPVRLTTAAEIDEYLQELQKDSKFQSWGISMEALRRHLSMLPLPLSFSDVLTAALIDYAGTRQPEVIIHKCGHYITCMPKILHEMPDARFIFVDRDPRAIYGSQKRSLDSMSGRTMQGDIVDFVLQYCHIQRAVNRAAGAAHLLVVRYETLMNGGLDQSMDVIAQYLGVRSLPGQKGSYYDDIPKGQRHLHERVASGIPDPDRVDAWKRELRPSEILFLDWSLARFLKQKEYDKWRCSGFMGFSELVALGWNCLRYVLETRFRGRQEREMDWCA